MNSSSTQHNPNPYEVTARSPSSFSPNPGEAAIVTLGRTQKAIPPDAISTITKTLRRSSGRNWILASLFSIVFVIVAFQLDRNSPDFFIALLCVVLLPLCAWLVSYYSTQMSCSSFEKLGGAEPETVCVTLNPQGIQISNDVLFHFGRWPLVQGNFVADRSWILLMPSMFHRFGLSLDFGSEPTPYEQLNRYASAIRMAPKNRKIDNRLIPTKPSCGIDIGEPMVQALSDVRSSDLSSDSEGGWTSLQRVFLASLGLQLSMIAFGYFSIFAILERREPALVFLIMMTLYLLFKQRRGLRILFRGQAVLSQIEIVVSRLGFEKRSNAHFMRSRWSAYRNASVENDCLMACYRADSYRHTLMNKRWFSKDEEWEKAIQCALEGIGRNGTDPKEDVS